MSEEKQGLTRDIDAARAAAKGIEFLEDADDSEWAAFLKAARGIGWSFSTANTNTTPLGGRSR